MPYEKWVQSLKPESLDCLIATSDFGGLQLMRQWNEFCVQHGRHFLPVVLQDLIGYVGPLVIPGETACFECLRARQNANLEEASARRAAEHAAFEGQGIVGCHPAMASVLGDIAAIELTKFYGIRMPIWQVGTLIEVNLLAGRMTPRKVLKVPRCAVCGTLNRAAPAGEFEQDLDCPFTRGDRMSSPTSSLRRLADNILEYLVDERVGIIHSVQEVPREAGAPDFFHFWASSCHVEAFSQQANFGRGGGASADRGTALAKAIGEAVERYCSALYVLEELPFASFTKAPFPCVPPSAFALYTPEQYQRPDFPFVPFTSETVVRWTPALDAATGATCFVPAACVFLPYRFHKARGDSPIAQPISTGLACHCSPTEAAITGICEVIERDAFTITWQARLSRPQLRVGTLSSANQDLVQRFAKAGHAITLLNITMDLGVPTVLALARGAAPEAPGLVAAAAASLDPEQAVRKSLEELDHTRAYCQKIKNEQPRLAADPNYEQVVNQESHLNFWCDSANAPHAGFLFASPERQAFSDLANLATGDPGRDLAVLVERVRAVHHQVLLCDVTTPDVSELGLAVVRALIPGFHPLAMGHHLRSLGSRRLWEVPRKLGYAGISPASGDNPYPHPYP